MERNSAFHLPAAGSMGEERAQGHCDPEMSCLTQGLALSLIFAL